MRRFPVESCSPAWRARSARSLSTGRGWPRCPDKPPPSRRTPPRFRGRPSASWASARPSSDRGALRSEEHTSELQSLAYLVCRLLLEKKKKNKRRHLTTHHTL